MIYSATTYQNATPLEMDLCNLLQTMKLGSPAEDPPRFASSVLPSLVARLDVQDDHMDEINYQSDGGSDCSSPNSSTNGCNGAAAMVKAVAAGTSEIFGCAYLQVLRGQLDNYATTGGEYIDAILTHREIFNSFPGAHRDCARAFTDLAYSIEQRAWRADRDADLDAVTAFRHEAWVIASALPV